MISSAGVRRSADCRLAHKPSIVVIPIFCSLTLGRHRNGTAHAGPTSQTCWRRLAHVEASLLQGGFCLSAEVRTAGWPTSQASW